MHGGGCWSSVVAAPNERAALALTPEHEWLVGCVLQEGHSGSHASDGAQPHNGRRRWLLWGDYARGAQNLTDEAPCPMQALDGAPCLYFAGHGGPHRYAAPVGRDFPEPPPRRTGSVPDSPSPEESLAAPPAAPGGLVSQAPDAARPPALEAPALVTPAPETPASESSAPETPAPETPVPEVLALEAPASQAPAPETPALEAQATEAQTTGAHTVEPQTVEPEAVEAPVPEWARRAGFDRPALSRPSDAEPEPARTPADAPAAEDDEFNVGAFNVSALDDLFAEMPSLKGLPQTDLLLFPENSFHPEPPAWPTSRGAYVGEHHAPLPVAPQSVVSGPARFEPAGDVIDVEPDDVDSVGRHVASPESSSAPDEAEAWRRRSAESADGPAGEPSSPRPRRRHRADDVDESAGGLVEVRPGATTVLTTPMVEVISSNWDPVRMGVPTARRALPSTADIVSLTAVVEDAAAQLQSLPELTEDGEVSAALNDVAVSLKRLARALKPH
ncbi:MAG: hypothetical protein WBA05_12535 [Gordonia sp. (in: high G+C Gram-positive bacteria)]